MDDAIADYGKAIQYNPNFQDAYYNRGVAKAEKGDFDGAVGDFDHTVALNPKYSQAFYNRGHVKYFKGDLDGAVADIEQAIALDPSSPFTYFIRGLCRLAKDDREGATTDFQQSATNGYANAALWLWVAKTENGERGEARSSLTDFLTRPQLFKPDDWATELGNFLLERIAQDQLIADAKSGTSSQERLCEAWFYSGMVKHFAGDAPGALECFRQSVATGATTSEVFVEAQRQLTTLQAP